ncbi:MAG: PDZ domain-containing protein [Bacteroidia bacterium]
MRTTAFILLLTIFRFVIAQERIHYDISFPNAVHHEAEISLTATEVPAGPFQVRMSLSSPGRYAIHQFGKNVSNVRAWDSQNHPLEIVRTEPEMWEVKQHGETVRITYTLFADWTDGTYSEIDEDHAHLNMPATFMWVRNMDSSPISINFHLPQGSDWKIATQLIPGSKSGAFTAPGLQYFMDSPTELSNHDLRKWMVRDRKGQSAEFRLAVHHEGSTSDVDMLEAATKQTVEEMIAVYGEMPGYDHGNYTFILDYRAGNDGDGMEHRNSTIITSAPSSYGLTEDLIGTVSHEYFHSWNVERLRPRSLEPFDFTRPNMCGELWFAEGFTSYYGPLVLIRAGIYSLEQYAAEVNSSLNFVLNSPGATIASPVEMSKMAPFKDAATSVDPTAFYNTFTSYYPYGEVTGLALDLEIRTRFPGKSLDDLMREMWYRFGKTEIPYSNTDIMAVLAEVVNDKEFAESFFNRYVYGHERPDYVSLLAAAGLQLQKVHPGSASLGMASLSFEGGKTQITGGTFIGSPLYNAGLEREDIIVTLAGRKIKSREALVKVLSKMQPGQTVEVVYIRRGKNHSTAVILTENPEWEIVPFEVSGGNITSEIRAFRESWLGSKRGR